MTAFRTSECRLCGRPIVWGASEDGSKKYPLDPRPPCYLVELRADGTYLARQSKEEPGRKAVFVSHFATCPKVDSLHRGPKKESGGGRGESGRVAP